METLPQQKGSGPTVKVLSEMWRSQAEQNKKIIPRRCLKNEKWLKKYEENFAKIIPIQIYSSKYKQVNNKLMQIWNKGQNHHENSLDESKLRKIRKRQQRQI